MADAVDGKVTLPEIILGSLIGMAAAIFLGAVILVLLVR